ncbi:MAG: 1-deoxy-D-xylulose 5-phosphate synthase (EC [uncultured Sulfurovum sp.]|uniref:1-deoxy-D-xylulose-5-phosphate synthase n=1 Tax=uncultured Sulfurovum sp. TaxID=269237 RepID=A0A6S6RYB8_9BACT|nr:MAG: 1-deoxy-D-xylulose 5-phosphate synthase (EC [uncultured Sulfurovum sp.]
MSKFGDLKTKTIEELEVVAQEVREKILSTVSKNGGHLSSTLGATDLIVAMHAVFDAKENPFIFDVSHQAYAHKLVTNRWDSFDTLRQFGGLSGYTKPKESECDYYMAGHSSTSISLATGAAKAIALKGEEETRIPLAVIGDGSMSAGMVYEAMNELGDRKYPAIIILNDNEMSIASPIGALSRILSQKMASPFYQKFKAKTKEMLEVLPDGATYLAKRFEESFHLITPGILFEELGLEYIGPIDGHNIESLIETLKIAKKMNRPVIIHTQTTKGKGYEVAEGAGSDKEHWHGVGVFDVATGVAKKKTATKASTAIFAETLVELADNDEKVVGVTAAMPSGTGMSAAIAKYPKRFWDVAIAEQHAVTSMGPLAKEGFKPFCALYSTFLQRGYDQLIHDICLMNLGVAFAIDRAGIVGEDGETHQGVFDISYLRAIPNMTIFAPSSNASMKEAMLFAKDFPTPCAFRYPRGAFISTHQFSTPFELGKSYQIKEGEDILFIGYGNGVGRAEQVADLIEANPSILDLRFVKPLDKKALLALTKTHKKWYVFSDSAKMGGVGSAILELLSEEKVNDIDLVSFEYDDYFITHGNTKLVEASLGVLPEQISAKIN